MELKLSLRNTLVLTRHSLNRTFYGIETILFLALLIRL